MRKREPSMKILVTHNAEIRNNGTGTYCMRALKQMESEGILEKATHFTPRGDAPAGYDWSFACDDGRDDLDWLPPRPWAYYAIDTHLGYGYRLWKAKQADRVFVAQQDAVASFKRDGVKHVEWLPLACQPDAHPCYSEFLKRNVNPDELTQRYDWAFVGFINGVYGDGQNNRLEYLDALQKAVPNAWITTGVFFEDMAIRYIRARLGFNLSIKRDLNMRVFEVLSTGTPLFTNRDVEGIDSLFTEGLDYIGFKGEKEMVDVARAALADEKGLKAIAEHGLKKVRKFHTYRHRMNEVVEVMKHV